jgi:hypothetical protein
MTTRREFLRNTALASAGLALSGISNKTNAASYSRIMGSNEKINLAHIGIGNRGWDIINDFGMGALGDWGAHILDTVHEFLDLGLPEEIIPVKLEGHNDYFFPMASTIRFNFPKRGNMPPVTVTWYDGVNNLPELPKGYGKSELDPNIPQVAGFEIEPIKLNPGLMFREWVLPEEIS